MIQQKFRISQYFKRKDTPECVICAMNERSTHSMASIRPIDDEGNEISMNGTRLFLVCAIHLEALAAQGYIAI